jgi:hypothetical protein
MDRTKVVPKKHQARMRSQGIETGGTKMRAWIELIAAVVAIVVAISTAIFAVVELQTRVDILERESEKLAGRVDEVTALQGKHIEVTRQDIANVRTELTNLHSGPSFGTGVESPNKGDPCLSAKLAPEMSGRVSLGSKVSWSPQECVMAVQAWQEGRQNPTKQVLPNSVSLSDITQGNTGNAILKIFKPGGGSAAVDERIIIIVSR